jgi:phage terminase small subunit
MTKPTLSKKQQRIVSEYLKDSNATKAAERAGYSKLTANQQGPRLMTNPAVKAAVEAKLLELQKKTDITVEKILTELWRVAGVDIRQAYKLDGSLKSIHEMPEDVARAIAGVDVDELFEGVGGDRDQVGITKKIRFWDKVRAFELLGKHLKMFVERQEHTGPGGAPLLPPMPQIDFSGITTAELRKAIGLYEPNGHNGHTGS